MIPLPFLIFGCESEFHSMKIHDFLISEQIISRNTFFLFSFVTHYYDLFLAVYQSVCETGQKP